MKLAIIGATRGIGRNLVEQAPDQGHGITAPETRYRFPGGGEYKKEIG